MKSETSKFKVGDKVIYETCSSLDQGFPELVGYQGTVVDFGRMFVYVKFEKIPPEYNDLTVEDLIPCSEEEIDHV